MDATEPTLRSQAALDRARRQAVARHAGVTLGLSSRRARSDTWAVDAWLRLVALFAVAVVAALVLKTLPAGVVLAVFVGGAVLVTRSLRARVRTNVERVRAAASGPAAPPAGPSPTPPTPADPAA